jgi:multidrug efflux pump
MSIGTIFTLFVVPMFYTYIAKETARPEPANDLAAPHEPPAEPHKPLLAAE